jgi:hypothetical protein
MGFTAGIYYGGEMRMNHYSLTLNMVTNTNDAVSHNVAFERIKYFVYEKLDSSILINHTHLDKCQQYIASGIPISTLPGDPVDQLIGLMLYYKLNAVMEDRIVIEETEISSILGENMIYLHSENEITDIGSVPNWWTTADPVSNDITLEADKIVNMHSNTLWREMNLCWPDSETSAETGNVVVFADFKNNNDSK